MEIRQVLLKKMAIFCYLIGDKETRTCGVIDPAFESGRILSMARRDGYRITHVINTHGHADHVAGNAAIIQATGARLMIHRADAAALEGLLNRTFCRLLGGRGSPRPDLLLRDGDTIRIGASALQVIHTPGHTPGGICLYSRGHVFTGDTLFVGAVGRTDLAGGSSGQLIDSIRKRLFTLPEDTKVWPGHDYGPLPASTIGREKRTNPFLQ